jgi:hypothetical protein
MRCINSCHSYSMSQLSCVVVIFAYVCICRALDDGRDKDRHRDRDRRSGRDRDHTEKKRRRSTSRERPSKTARDGVKSRKADAFDPDIIEANAERAKLGLKPLR